MKEGRNDRNKQTNNKQTNKQTNKRITGGNSIKIFDILKAIDQKKIEIN